MKTVKDYLDLGLVFVAGDKICGVTDDLSSNELDIFDGKLCGKKASNRTVKIGADCYARARWTPSSFAWRNNDGVKPEYKGVIDAVTVSKHEYKGFSSESELFEFEDDRSDDYVIKWRPVVLQSESPAVSPKEDKPMKPVYTAEMHAKNELPPVGSKVKVCIEEAGFYVDEQDVKFEGKAVTVKAAFSNAESEKIVAVENEDGNCYCYIIECIKPIIKTIKVNGFDVHAPMSETPGHRQMVYLAHAAHLDFNLDFTWQGDDAAVSWLSRGLIHSTESAAVAHAKAMLGINPNPARGGDGYDRNVLGQNNEGDEI